MRFSASVVLALALVAHAQPAASQDPPPAPCVKETMEAAAAQIVLRWANQRVALKKAMQEAVATNPDPPLDDPRIPDWLPGELAAYRMQREHMLAVHEWKLGVQSECLEEAGEGAYSDEVSLQEIIGYLQGFNVWGELRLAPTSDRP